MNKTTHHTFDPIIGVFCLTHGGSRQADSGLCEHMIHEDRWQAFDATECVFSVGHVEFDNTQQEDTPQ